MKLPSLQAAFTLIEFLVVIAIISLLSSIVLASLGQARAKAADAVIKSELLGVRVPAEIVYQAEGCYDADVTSDCSLNTTLASNCIKSSSFVFTGNLSESIFRNQDIQGLIEAANKASGGFVISGAVNFFSNSFCVQEVNGGAWAVAVQYKSNPQLSWCVDSTNASKEVDPSINHGFVVGGFACK